MQIREVQDADRRGESGNRYVDPPPLHPLRLEEPPRRERDERGGDNPEPGRYGVSSFWSTGSTDTTWRLNLSSEASSPAATPISCERCRIGMLNARPVCASSFCCQASSDRWQSGQGVTIASAPASIACSIG